MSLLGMLVLVPLPVKSYRSSLTWKLVANFSIGWVSCLEVIVSVMFRKNTSWEPISYTIMALDY